MPQGPIKALVLLAAAIAPLSAQFSTRLEPATVAAFEQYRKTLEAKGPPSAHYRQMKNGEIRVDPARDDGSIEVKDGIVHDWVAGALVAGATSQDLLGVLQNYAAYKNVYAPDVVDSRLLSRNGDQYRVFLKIVKKKVLTVTLNGEFDVEFRDLGNGRWLATSKSTRLAEVEDGKELPLGTGHGFLWRLNAYWLIEPRPGGLYVECRTLSLSRDVPFLLGYVVKPFVGDVPKESLQDTMSNTVKALRGAVARRTGQEYPTIAQQEVGNRSQANRE